MVIGEDGAELRFEEGIYVAQPPAAKYWRSYINAPGDVRNEQRQGMERRLGDVARAWGVLEIRDLFAAAEVDDIRRIDTGEVSVPVGYGGVGSKRRE